MFLHSSELIVINNFIVSSDLVHAQESIYKLNTCNNSHTKIWCDVHISSFRCEVHAKFSVNSHHNQYELILALMLNYFKLH